VQPGKQDPGDVGVELGQDPGDDVPADHPDAGDLVSHRADLRPGRLEHRVWVRDWLAEVVGVRQRVGVAERCAGALIDI